MPARTWRELLATPAPGQHIAQFYTDLEFLAAAVERFAGASLRRGEAVLLVVTPFHFHSIARRLQHVGLGVAGAERRGQLTVLDADQALAAILVDGIPDRERFLARIGGAVDAASAAGYPRIRVFGEMVDLLLRRSDVTATVRLEELWNEVLSTRGVALLCGYSLDTFDPHIYRGPVQRITRVHSDVIPIEDYERLEWAVERAYTEVFGTGGDAGSLRRLFLAHYARPAAMPDGAAAILAAQEFAPLAADRLVEKARRYYSLLPAR